MPRLRMDIDQEAVMRAVLNEVATCGVARVSMRAVARAVRMSPGAFYERFPNRTALFASTYDHFRAHAEFLIDSNSAEYPEALPFGRFWLELVQQFIHDAHGRAFVALYGERASFLSADQLKEIHPRILGAWLDRNRDLLGPAPVEIQARIVWGMLSACMSEQSGRPVRNAAVTRTIGEACWAALCSGRSDEKPLELPPAPGQGP